MNTIIIGGGAAGMTAAVAAARRGDTVTVLERNRKTLKKLGVTGNGRGNLLNSGAPEYYGDSAFAAEVLRRMPYERLAAFWEEAGVPLVEEAEGRIYPASYLAASAVDALRLTAERLGVFVRTCTRTTALSRQGGGFHIEAMRALYAEDVPRKNGKRKAGALLGEEPCTFTADRVIVAVGGAAAPAHGTDGSAYGLLTALGHTLTPIRPALCALLTERAPIEGLSGQRVRSRLTLCGADGSLLHESAGEALFAEDGVSGIAAMQLARFVTPECVLRMDLRPAVTGRAETDPLAWLRLRAQRCPDGRELLIGAASPPLTAALWRMAGVKPATDEAALRALSEAIRCFELPVLGTRGMESAQVTAGGVRPSEFDPATMESRLCPNLYAAGEVLDVDGPCGGYNLMFTFATGLLAGKGA